MPPFLSTPAGLAMLLAGAYAIGGISPGWWLVRRSRGGDIRDVGSGQTGATNVGRVLGNRGFGLVLLLDAVKGAAAVLGVRLLAPSTPWAALALPAVIAGHIWPVWLGFRGGRGGGPLLGGCAAFDWRLASVSVLVGLAIGGLARNRFAAGASAVGFSLLAVWWLEPGAVERLCYLGGTGLVLLAHRAYFGKYLRP
jgi:glycerol-3-phosphate acyltransferase PlsY